MDLVRSCYSVQMQFDEAGENVHWVTWYFVPPGTPWFPDYHEFGSANWSPNGGIMVGLGERWDSARPYSNGKARWPLATPMKFCGKAEWFGDGTPSDAPSLRLSPSGQPDCCVPRGGILLGGTSKVFLVPPYYGGIETGGTSSISTDRLYTGGLLTGGSSLYAKRYPATGGILVAGSYQRGLSTLRTGGVKSGGSSVIRTASVRTGGILVGGSSRLSKNLTTFGGIRLGGTSTVGLHFSKFGGIRTGGTSVATIPCQPWVFSQAANYTAFDVTNGYFWTLQTSFPSAANFIDPRLPGVHMSLVTQGGTDCLGQGTKAASTIVVNNSYSLVLLSYDASSKTGTWRIPSAAPFGYGSRIIQFKLNA